MLSEQEVQFFQENGYLPARPLLTAEEVARLRERFYALLEGRSSKKPEAMRNLYGDEERVVIQIVNAWEADDEFYRYLFHPKLTEAVAKLMNTDTVRVWHDQIQYKPPYKGGPTIWHQDHPYWPVLQPPDLVSAWLALEDADVENGCMHVVPRSHRWGKYDEGTVGIREEDWGPAHDPSFVAWRDRRGSALSGEGRRGHVPPLFDLARNSAEPQPARTPRFCSAFYARTHPLRTHAGSPD